MSNNRKVLSIIVACLLFSIVILTVNYLSTAVAEEEIVHETIQEVEQEDILVRVQTLLVDNGIRVTIVYDVETKVMYMISRGGGVCMLVDSAGNPRLYENAN